MFKESDARIEVAHKKALIEGNPYELVIQYELKDSVYTPVDTVFYKKELKNE